MPIDKDISRIDRMLAHGGFKRATSPKGSLDRSRLKRDAKKAQAKPVKAKSSAKQAVEILRPDWPREKAIAGFSTRAGGASTSFGAPGGGHDLNLGYSQDNRATVESNRRKFLQHLFGEKTAAASKKLVTLKQIHSDITHVIESASPRPLTGDGLLTQRTDVILGILVADCVPVLLWDPKKKAIAAFHAGWRGTVKRIVEKGAGLMRAHFGSKRDVLYNQTLRLSI